MAVQRYDGDIERIAAERLEAWAGIPAAVAGDSLNRQQVMAARIKPVGPGMSVTGQAFTIDAFHGDNGAIHAALATLPPSVVLVVNGGGLADRAIWGGILNTVAMRRKALGVVVDGAVRDVAELRGHGLPVFAAAVCPAGPAKGWGGTVNGPVSCGGVVVQPGDVIRADDDGVVAIPLSRERAAYDDAVERLAMEKSALDRVDAGEDTAGIFNAPPVESIGPE